MTQAVPRYVTSVLVEEDGGSVTVIWELGDVIPGDVEFFGYGVDYYGADGNGGKRLGVFFGQRVGASVFDWESNTNANYEPDSVTLDGDRLVVFYRDACIGLPAVGTIKAFSHMNGQDVQSDLQVTMLR